MPWVNEHVSVSWLHLQAVYPEPRSAPSQQCRVPQQWGLLFPGRGMEGTMGRDIFDPFFVPATVRLRENQTVCVAGIVFRLEKPGVWNTETIV